VINEALMNALIHCGFAFFCSLHIQNSHEWLNCDALQEHREVNDANCRCNKQRLQLDVIGIDQQHQGECNGASQAAIRHDKLIHLRQFVDAESIRHGNEYNDACCVRRTETTLDESFDWKERRKATLTNNAEKRAKQYCQQDEPSVPLMAIVDCRNTQKHENNRF